MSKAFTLIELLVVIAIIAILAAILFPVLAQAKESSKRSVSATRAKQMTAAGMLYQGDNDDRFWQLSYTGQAGLTIPDNQGFFRWPWLLHPYARSFEVFIDGIDAERPEFRDPNSPVYGYAIGLTPSFGYNARYFSPGEDPALPDHDPYIPVSGTSAAAPAETVLFASSVYYEPLSSPKVGYFRIYPPAKWTRELPARGRSWGHVWPRFFKRIVTVAWADGHVSGKSIPALDKETLWQVEKRQ